MDSSHVPQYQKPQCSQKWLFCLFLCQRPDNVQQKVLTWFVLTNVPCSVCVCAYVFMFPNRLFNYLLHCLSRSCISLHQAYLSIRNECHHGDWFLQEKKLVTYEAKEASRPWTSSLMLKLNDNGIFQKTKPNCRSRYEVHSSNVFTIPQRTSVVYMLRFI